jgi:GH15 family glucan-1,4-alpha-glucosidase
MQKYGKILIYILIIAKDAEMQAAVEHIERQFAVAKKSWAEYEERAHTAEVIYKIYIACPDMSLKHCK